MNQRRKAKAKIVLARLPPLFPVPNFTKGQYKFLLVNEFAYLAFAICSRLDRTFELVVWLKPFPRPGTSVARDADTAIRPVNQGAIVMASKSLAQRGFETHTQPSFIVNHTG